MVGTHHGSLIDVEWHIQRGDLREALIELEREFPSLTGLVHLLDKNNMYVRLEESG